MEAFFGDKGQKDDPSKVKKPCRACLDFKTWAKLKPHDVNNDNASKENQSQGQNSPNSNRLSECPLDKDELGRNTWSFLHTMAAYFPDKPSDKQQKEMSVFVKLFSKYYPCDHCAEDFRHSIAESPPETKTRWDFSQWLCKMHNQVNRKLGKEEFDCNLVDKRWKDGWDDGSCD